ncbi:hypothetical protein [Halorubrum pallidum]|uniref:Uncharacterized protein n=1 Tax=Halorubrum pallidum TaxID=1526114 RepID=A0ABD5T9L9_9EURY
MDPRRRLYVAGFVGASISYIFNVLAFTGQFDVVRWFVFAVVFVTVFFGFEKFIEWSVRFDN